jgi:glycosyltransferase involved in cell wall biosynthesis
LDFILRKLLKNKIKFLSVSSYQNKILIGRGVQSEVIKTIPLFSSFPIAKKIVPVKNKKSLNIIFVGRLEVQKGIYDLIEFIRRSPFIATLKIVGDGEEKNKIENLIKKDRILSKKVKLYGSIFGKELINLIDISDIFINPSQYLETFGLVNIEAMSRGKIVLSSKTGALGEVIKDGVNGFLFDPKIKKSIDESLNKIIANTNLFKIQKNSIETAKKNSIENHVEKILTYYNSVLSK